MSSVVVLVDISSLLIVSVSSIVPCEVIHEVTVVGAMMVTGTYVVMTLAFARVCVRVRVKLYRANWVLVTVS